MALTSAAARQLQTRSDSGWRQAWNCLDTQAQGLLTAGGLGSPLAWAAWLVPSPLLPAAFLLPPPWPLAHAWPWLYAQLSASGQLGSMHCQDADGVAGVADGVAGHKTLEALGLTEKADPITIAKNLS